MQTLKTVVKSIGFNDDLPDLDKNAVKVVFQALEKKWHHTAELIIFIDKNDSASIAEYKRAAIAQAKLVLQAMIAALP